jgi:hypothetical protein
MRRNFSGHAARFYRQIRNIHCDRQDRDNRYYFTSCWPWVIDRHRSVQTVSLALQPQEG